MVFVGVLRKALRKIKFHVTSRCSITPALRAYVGQFLSRGFVVLLRKSVPQNHNLKTAAELGVTWGKKIKATASAKLQKQKLCSESFVVLGFTLRKVCTL